VDSQTKLLWRQIQEVGRLTPLSQPLGLVTMLTHIGLIVLGWGSVTLEVWMVKPGTMGSRLSSLLRLFMGYLTMGVFTFFFTLLGTLFGGLSPLAFLGYSGGLRSLFVTGTSSLLYHLFFYGFLGLSALHLFCNWRRERQGVVWHSMSSGISWLEYLIPWQRLIDAVPYLGRVVTADEYLVKLYIDAPVCYLAGRLIGHADSLLGWWLVIAAVALGLRNWLMYFEMRGRVLDMVDATIESTYLSAALSGQPKQQTAGFSVVPVSMHGMIEGEAFDLAATVQETLGLDAPVTD